MRSRRALLLLAVIAFAGANLWFTFQRSAIPLDLDGVVSRIEVRREKHPGLDDVYLVTVGARTVHLDTAVGRRLRRGDRISKAAWARTLRTPRGEIDLGPSQDVRGMALAMPVVLVLSVAVTRRGA